MQSLALENYGTSELSFDEQRETDGGIWPLLIAGACLLLSSCSQSNSSSGSGNTQSNTMNTSTKADSSSAHGHIHVSPK